MECDDLSKNITGSEIISDLYLASDLHLITSRWEGGPRSVLEAAATKTAVLCTPVGIAPDILSAKSLYSSVDEAVIKAEQHYHDQWLSETTEPQFQTILDYHTPERNVPLFEKLYREIEAVTILRIGKVGGETGGFPVVERQSSWQDSQAFRQSCC